MDTSVEHKESDIALESENVQWIRHSHKLWTDWNSHVQQHFFKMHSAADDMSANPIIYF